MQKYGGVLPRDIFLHRRTGQPDMWQLESHKNTVHVQQCRTRTWSVSNHSVLTEIYQQGSRTFTESLDFTSELIRAKSMAKFRWLSPGVKYGFATCFLASLQLDYFSLCGIGTYCQWAQKEFCCWPKWRVLGYLVMQNTLKTHRAKWTDPLFAR